MTKSLHVAAKSAETLAAHKRAATAGSQHQPATYVAGSRGASPREDVDPELFADYSGESDDASDSNPFAPLPGLPGVIPHLRSVRRGTVVR